MLINLNRRIDLWQERGVVSAAIAEQIRQFEASQNNRSWVAFGIAAVGVTAVATGVVSVVAANWSEIPEGVKLLMYFALQCAVGWAFLRNQHRPGVIREASLTLFAVLFLAGIGLCAQIYNLSGPAWQSALFWVGLALLPTLCADSRMLPSLWCFGLILASHLWSMEHTLGNRVYFVQECVSLSVPFLLTSFGLAGHALKYVKEPLRNASLVWGLGVLLAFCTPVINSRWVFNSEVQGQFVSAEMLSAQWLVWGSAALAAYLSLIRPGVRRELRICTAALFVTLAAYALLPWVLPIRQIFSPTVGQILGALGFLLVWSLAAASAAMASMKRLFDIASFVIAVRFIVIYFEVFGSLSTTGVGLIVSGGVILVIAMAWNRSRREVVKRLEGAL